MLAFLKTLCSEQTRLFVDQPPNHQVEPTAQQRCLRAVGFPPRFARRRPVTQGVRAQGGSECVYCYLLVSH